jgi:hypothetical protein
MVLGFNHNVMYKGDVFHVQTEDSGVAIPHIITLLYRGGVILCSKKTSYSDILMMDNLEVVVEELMKEQHKEMMRRLKAGEFDERAFPGGAPVSGKTEESSPKSAPGLDKERAASPPARESVVHHETPKLPHATPPQPPAAAANHPERSRKVRISLDEAIVAFFAAHEKQSNRTKTASIPGES